MTHKPRSRWASRIERYAFWPLLLIFTYVLYARGLELAQAAGCQLGENCMSQAGIEASLYIAIAVLLSIAIAAYFVVFYVWKVIKLVLKLARTKAQDQRH
jgi:hypothetical protein